MAALAERAGDGARARRVAAAVAAERVDDVGQDGGGSWGGATPAPAAPFRAPRAPRPGWRVHRGMPDVISEDPPAGDADAPLRQASTGGFTVGSLPSGPAARRLAEAAAHVPDRPERVLALATEALALAGDDALTAVVARTYQGYARYLLSDHEAALDLLTRALAAVEPLGDLAGRSLALGALASVHVSLGHYDQAIERAVENLRVARALGDVEREAWVRATMGNTYVELDQPALAIEHGEAALRLFGELGHAGGQARAHTVLGGALADLGRADEAEAHHRAALRLAREQGATLTEARALADLGRLAHQRGDGEGALALHRDALRLRAAVGNRQSQATSLIAIGQTLVGMGQSEDARVVLEEALGIARETGAEPRQAQASAALADACQAAGDLEAAVGHLRAYHALHERLLSAQARSRLQTVEVRAEAERAQQEAEMARLRTEELGAANAELSATLDELRAAQRRLVQSEKLASLGRLSAGLAHEIQNPLNFVAGFSDLNAELAESLLDGVRQARDGGAKPDLDEVEEDLTAIADNARRVRDHARRADGIVRSLMGHVRDVGGERRPADLHALLDAAVAGALDRSAVTVERAYGRLGPVRVEAGSLRRVFANLLDNARWAAERHAEATGAAPTVRLETAAFEGGVEVRVVDNGVGIPLADCTRVFEPFFTTKPAGQGTGLGLSLAYDIVTEGHGGTLAAHSREGEGATFVVTLPREGEWEEGK